MMTRPFVPATPRPLLRRPRTCITCGAPYHAPGTLRIDPRCPVCAVNLATREDHGNDLGTGD